MVQFVLIFQKLQQVVLNPGADDKLLWWWCPSGVYSAASAYKVMFLGESTILGIKEVCKTKAPNKCHFFAWLTLKERNWASERQWRHGLPDDSACTLYSQDQRRWMCNAFSKCGSIPSDAVVGSTWCRAAMRILWNGG
jgi:hypothetical protein